MDKDNVACLVWPVCAAPTKLVFPKNPGAVFYMKFVSSLTPANAHFTWLHAYTVDGSLPLIICNPSIDN